jgi:uncharacterized membrane protein
MANAAVTAPGQSTALAVNQITLDHPWEWLAKGWKDLASVPRFSLLYGSVFLLVSYALTLGPMSRELFFRVPPLAAGFFLLAPVLGICTLYLGRIVTMPLVGHATWHAQRDLVPRS